MKRVGGAVVVWAGSAAVLGVLTSHVRDWFVMTDELLYERLALSVVHTDSPLPRVHGVSISSVDQLYPLLLATVLGHGSIADAMHSAHLLNAIVMTSAAVPAFLLARRLVGPLWAAGAALFTVAVPWLVLASFLLTGVAAYPAFLWSVLACTVCVERPSVRNDVLALLSLGLAVGARTQFVVLALVLPLAVLARRDLRRHRTLLVAYGLGGVLVLLLVALGHNPLGTYGSTTQGNVLPAGTVGATFTHLASVGIGLALLPLLVGGAWLVTEARRDEFALVGSLTVVLLAIEVAAYDERFGAGLARDRYVFYLAPLFVIAFVASAVRRELRAWALGAMLGVTVLGLALSPLPVFEKLYADAPVAILDNYLLDELGGLHGARAFLVAVALLAAAFVAVVWFLVPRRLQALALVVPALVLTTAQTGYAFERLFRIDGTAGRPLTDDPSGVHAWIDPLVHGASVAMVPFPVITGDYFSSAAYWWDVEFWNRSVDRSVGVPHEFEWTPSTFPKIAIRFDRLGRANVSPSPYVLQAVGDTRFHLRGDVVTNNRSAFLVHAELPWRVDWSTRELYDDGWTIPGRAARILVYPYPGQEDRRTRSISVSMFAPPGVASRRFVLASGLERNVSQAGSDEVTQGVNVCVGPARPAVVRLRVDGSSPAPGDTRTDRTVGEPRRAGVQVSRIYVSGDVGPAC